jgi:RiboL-PSP-HEPN
VKALAHFDAVWSRCAHLSALHAYLASNVSRILQPDELLQAEWVARVSALDLYIHELVAQLMLEIFDGLRPNTPAYLRFQISNDALSRIRAAPTTSEASAAFDLYIRERLSRITYQDPDDIADGIRLCSTIELWNEVAIHFGATPSTKVDEAKNIKTQLSLIVRRRNIIAHEGDLQQSSFREPWPITQADLALVTDQIERLVRAIDAVIA